LRETLIRGTGAMRNMEVRQLLAEKKHLREWDIGSSTRKVFGLGESLR